MTPTHPWRKTFLLLAAMVARVYASDPTAVYARIDKVVLQPTAAMPETVQIWGVFSVAKPNDRNDYLAPARGYWYFKLADNPEAARSEWADLNAVAGTGQIVSFGSRYEFHAALRKADETPKNPDPYIVHMGLTKVSGRTAYAPIRALIDYRN